MAVLVRRHRDGKSRLPLTSQHRAAPRGARRSWELVPLPDVVCWGLGGSSPWVRPCGPDPTRPLGSCRYAETFSSLSYEFHPPLVLVILDTLQLPFLQFSPMPMFPFIRYWLHLFPSFPHIHRQVGSQLPCLLALICPVSATRPFSKMLKMPIPEVFRAYHIRTA